MNRATGVMLAIIVVTATLSAAVIGAGASSSTPSQDAVVTESEAYAGTHVAFEASTNAVANFSIDDEVLFETVAVNSQNEHHGEAGIGADGSLSAVTNVSGTGLALEAQTETRAEIGTEGSASMTAHDTERGILTVDAGEEDHYVEVNLSGESNADARADAEDRVVVESDTRSGAFVVVGDGDVTVNDDGDIVADLGSESTLVFRSYGDDERDESAREQESLIAEGTATAEVYADERDGERVVDVATYGQDIALDAHGESEERLEMTVERAESEGTVVIASVSETALEAVSTADDLEVTVDGEAAAEASSYGELEGGIGEEPRYMVTQSSDAAASADVLVAVDHFSERELVVQESESDSEDADETDDTSDEDETNDGDDADGDSLPGFGVGVALVALLIAATARLQR